MTKQLGLIWLFAAAGAAYAQDPFADTVIEFIPGTGITAEFGSDPPVFFDDPNSALGEPTRIGGFGPITPFNPAALASEVVSIGAGGSLTVGFNEAVLNDPNNPFGVDLLIFGNSFLGLNFPSDFSTDETTTANGAVDDGGGVVEVSSDGVTFFEVPGVSADGLFPTLGFSDITVPFPASGSVPTDFTLPVDPSLTADDFADLNTAEVVALFDGSGGGLGVDIGSLGLDEVSFVRVSTPAGSSILPEIDGFADVAAVPEPSAMAIGFAGFALLIGGRRRG